MTQSILTSEINGNVNGFDFGFLIKQTLVIIYKRIDLVKVPFILSTDSYLLYECLIVLGTISEKWLMIHIMVLWQLYKRKKIDGIIDLLQK